MHITTPMRQFGDSPPRLRRAAPKTLLPAFYCLFALLCLVCAALPAAAQVSLKEHTSANGPDFEVRAMQLLQQMAAAYSRLTSLEQHTEFYSSYDLLTPPKADPNAPPPANGGQEPPPSPLTNGEQGKLPAASNAAEGKERKMDLNIHLVYQQPNYLLMEMQDTDASNQTNVSRWISDGKMFWSYVPEKHWYTQDKAPGRIREFARLPHLNSGCLELLMLMGINPFTELKEAVDSIRYEGTETLHGVETEVVSIQATEPTERVELRLYIGKADLLLRRLATERTPILKDTTGKPPKVGDSLDELANDLQPIQPVQPVQQGEILQPDPMMPGDPTPLPATPIGPVRTRLVYDNILSGDTHFAPQLFSFTPPPDAKLYRPAGAPTQIDPRSRGLLGMIKKGKIHKVRAPREVNP